jgi:hypothetical protein
LQSIGVRNFPWRRADGLSSFDPAEFARDEVKQRQNGSPVMAPQPTGLPKPNQTKAYEEIQ